jgi:hypothetical protein
VKRQYKVANVNGSDVLSRAELYYADNELQSITNENKLGIRDYNGSTWSSLTPPGYTKVYHNTGFEDTLYASGLSTPLNGVTELAMVNSVVTPLVAHASFSNPVQWSSGAVPDSTDDVEIDSIGVTVGLNPAFAGTLTIDHGYDLTVDNSLTVGNASGGLVSLSGALTIKPSQTLTINHGKLTVSGTITNNGTVNINP